MSPTHLSPGASAAGVPVHQVGAGVDVVGGDGGADLPARLSGFQTLLPHEGGGGVSGDTTVPLRFRAAAGRRYPQNHVGGLELGLDQQCQLPPSDLRGGLGPAQPVVVAGLRHSDQFAHGGDGVIAFFAADEPCGARSPTFSREEGRRFFQELASLRATRASPPSAWRSRPTPRRPRGPGPRRASSCTWRPSPPPSAEPDRRRRPRTRSCAPSPGSRERPAP